MNWTSLCRRNLVRRRKFWPCSTKLVHPHPWPWQGPRFFGFVIGGTLPATLAANWLAAVWDQATGLNDVTPMTAKLEQVSMRWLLDILGLPPECGGGFVTGATMASFSGLASARYSVLKQAGWDVDADGLFGAPPINVYVSEEVHPAVTKSLGLLGLGRDRLTRMATDDQGRDKGAGHAVRIGAGYCLCTGREREFRFYRCRR